MNSCTVTFYLWEYFHESSTLVSGQSEVPLIHNLQVWPSNELLSDREAFASLVREVASPDVGRMGIEILSFTIKDIEDPVNYLDSLGKMQTAKVKRDADIGVAEAHRDAGIRVKFCAEFVIETCICSWTF